MLYCVSPKICHFPNIPLFSLHLVLSYLSSPCLFTSFILYKLYFQALVGILPCVYIRLNQKLYHSFIKEVFFKHVIYYLYSIVPVFLLTLFNFL